MKIRYIALIAMLFVVSCDSSFDDTELELAVEGVEQNQEYLADDVENLKSSIAALEKRIAANDVITEIEERRNDVGEVVGYTINFAWEEILVIYNGKDGIDGDKGIPGEPGLDGEDYVDGEPGEKGPTGDAGQDGTDKSIKYEVDPDGKFVTINVWNPDTKKVEKFNFKLSGQQTVVDDVETLGAITLSLDGKAVGEVKLEYDQTVKPITITLPEEVTSKNFDNIKVAVYGEDGSKAVGVYKLDGSLDSGSYPWNMTYTNPVFDATSGACTTQPSIIVVPIDEKIASSVGLIDITLTTTSGLESNANVAFEYAYKDQTIVDPDPTDPDPSVDPTPDPSVTKVSATKFVNANTLPAELTNTSTWVITDCTEDDLNNIFTVIKNVSGVSSGIDLTIEGLTSITKQCGASSNHSKIKSISMPDLVTVGAVNFFGNMTALETLDLPELTSLSAGYFCKSTKASPSILKKVYMPKLSEAGAGNFDLITTIEDLTIATDPSVTKFTMAGNSDTVFNVASPNNTVLSIGKAVTEADKSITVDDVTKKITLYVAANGTAKPQKYVFKEINVVDNTK